ncbi:MAG: hypothetical protein AB7I59_21895 [Geminicoccaceae bacterium]
MSLRTGATDGLGIVPAGLASSPLDVTLVVLSNDKRESGMSQLAGYVDRMARRLADLERQIRDLGAATDGRVARDLDAGLASLRDRLNMMRRSGADLGEEATQSFTQAFERLQAAVGGARLEHART